MLFDGIDPKGANRPIGAPRRAQMVGSSERIQQLFAREDCIGEGDLKLADLGRRMRKLSYDDAEFAGIKLSLCTTIDSDSFAIELIEEAKRGKQQSGETACNTLLCMRERARKRRCDDDGDNGKEAFYLCCDISLLHDMLQTTMWGRYRSPSSCDRQAAMTLMAAGWALCGCDFVACKGMRSDAVFDSIGSLVKTMPSVIEQTKSAWSGDRRAVSNLHDPIRKLAIACASWLDELPRTRKDIISNIRSLDDITVRRTAWLMSYWNSCEFRGGMEEFGFVRPFA